MTGQLEIITKENFKLYSDKYFNRLKENELGEVTLNGESTLFVRFSQAKVRQLTHVDQIDVGLTLASGQKKKKITIPYSEFIDDGMMEKILRKMREELSLLPDDPFFVAPIGGQSSSGETKGELPPLEEILSCLESAGGDLAGIFTSGPLYEGQCNSLGTFHWFSNQTFIVDFSAYGEKGQAVKGLYAGKQWNREDFEKEIAHCLKQLEMLKRPRMEVKPGKHDAFLGPMALGEVLEILSWSGVSYDAYKRGRCPFHKLLEGEKTLSPKFSLTENFELGYCPSFNSLGEVAPKTVNIIKEGKADQFLVNSRTAKEYGIEANGANSSESFRSPYIHGGNLEMAQAEKSLGKGLYLSNLHYLNWSDVLGGRVTGMTRYACFWVEDGEIKAPLKDLRFDETIFHLFGEGLAEFTKETRVLPNTMTYGRRHSGASVAPGAIVKDMSFTL